MFPPPPPGSAGFPGVRPPGFGGPGMPPPPPPPGSYPASNGQQQQQPVGRLSAGGFPKPPVDQMRGMTLGQTPPGAMQGMPLPPGMTPPPPPPGAMANGAPGGLRPPGFGGFVTGPPPMPSGPPSSGMPINMPAHMGPPSTNTGMLAGIPPSAPARPMGPPGTASSGQPGPSILNAAPGVAGMAARGMPFSGPPPPPPMSGSGLIPPPPPPMSANGNPGSQFNGPHAPPPFRGPGIPPAPMSQGATPGMVPYPPQGPMPMGGMHGMPPPPMPPGFQQQPPPPPLGAAQQRMGPPPPQQPSNRIDPSQIPRPPAAPAATVQYETRAGGQHSNPPPAASRFVVHDTGSAGPRYMRASLNLVPHTQELLNNTQMPFALMAAPLALPDSADSPLQVVDLGELGPVRCSRCKAYMNPFMRFTASGRSFVCNFCNATSPTPDAYFCHLGPNGRRHDADEKPELCCGAVEYLATKDYMVRPPMAPAHFFLVDVTQTAVTTGATATMCGAISHALDHMPFPERTMVGLATFDSSLHFYALRGAERQPQILVVSDVTDVFAPDSAPLLVPLAEHKEALQSLLTSIPNIHSQNRVVESCAGSAIEAVGSLLQAKGGKLHAFLSVLPTVGLHALKVRDGMMGASEKEKLAFLASQDNTCKSTAMQAAEFQVSFDIALLAQGYMDVATLTDLVSSTGGTLYQYTPFNPVMDHDQVLNDLKWNLVRPQGMEAVMRVRCSQGLDVSHYSGHFYRMPSNPTDVYLPAIDSDKGILAVLNHTEKLTPGQECYLQAALLYTCADGTRRIRVHTLALPITDNIFNVYKGADLDTITCVMGRKLAGSLQGSTLSAARESITASVVGSLHAYRKFCAANSSAIQLILPEGLKLLPLYALALLKGPPLKDGAKPDERALWCANMMSLPAARITPLLYPRLLSVSQVLAQGGVEQMGGLPEGAVASAESLQAESVYLLENGHDAYLYFDKATPAEVLQDVLGVDSYEALCRVPGNFPLLPRDNAASAQLQEMLTKVRIHRSSFMRLRVARKGDPAEVAFFNGLVEDRSSAGMSYVEYLCQIHRLIQNKFA